jgi:phosphomevalonate kinase
MSIIQILSKSSAARPGGLGACPHERNIPSLFIKKHSIDCTCLQLFSDSRYLESPLTTSSRHSNPHSPPNPFVETTLLYTLTYIHSILNPTSSQCHLPTDASASIHPIKIRPIKITILAHPSFYSQTHTSTPCPANPSSPFPAFNVTLQEAHKTGLGSSAALVTALTASLLTFYLPKHFSTLENTHAQAKVHNLAQINHISAQGKIGSGFDVAAAVYGSCVYRRFSPSLLSVLSKPGTDDFPGKLQTLVDDDGTESKLWDQEIIKSAVSMPKDLRIIMCDVDCGSSTPGMVKAVNAWRETDASAARELWSQIQTLSTSIAAELARLAASPLTDSSSPDKHTRYVKIRTLVSDLRGRVRAMSAAAGVPIEPPVQTKLLDRCSTLPGVVGGVVPGAGGFDAVALIVEDRNEVLEGLAAMLEGYDGGSEKEVGEDTAKGDGVIGRVGVLGVREEMVGLKAEHASLYKGWLS